MAGRDGYISVCARRCELAYIRLDAGSDMKHPVKVYDRRLPRVFDRLIWSRYHMCCIVEYVRRTATPSPATAAAAVERKNERQKSSRNLYCLIPPKAPRIFSVRSPKVPATSSWFGP